jgi:arylsulfatase A-like enzyme
MVYTWYLFTLGITSSIFIPITGNRSTPDNWDKQIHVPLVIKWPKMMHLSETINQTVTLMDVMPTILHLTNTSYSNGTLNGKSLVGLINGTMETLHSYVFHYLDVTRPSAVTHKEFKVFYSTMSGNCVTVFFVVNLS